MIEKLQTSVSHKTVLENELDEQVLIQEALKQMLILKWRGSVKRLPGSEFILEKPISRF